MFLFSAAITTENRNKLTAARAGRLRTDLGGLYFNLIGILALAGLYAATNAEILRLAIAVIRLEMLEQLLPFAGSTATGSCRTSAVSPTCSPASHPSSRTP